MKVLFDSDRPPAVAACDPPGRPRPQVLYHIVDFRLTLHIEPTRDGQRTIVIGQVVSANESADGVHGVTVRCSATCQ